MLVGATWGTLVCPQLFIYSWRVDLLTQLAFGTSVVLAGFACIEARNPSGVRLSSATSRYSPRVARVSLWGVWILGLATILTFIVSRVAPEHWRHLVATLLDLRKT